MVLPSGWQNVPNALHLCVKHVLYVWLVLFLHQFDFPEGGWLGTKDKNKQTTK